MNKKKVESQLGGIVDALLSRGEFVIKDKEFCQPDRVENNVKNILVNLTGYANRYRTEFKDNILVARHDEGALLLVEKK